MKAIHYPEVIERVQKELNQLQNQIRQLQAFIVSPRSDEVPLKHKKLLRSQQLAMEEYARILQVRLEDMRGESG